MMNWIHDFTKQYAPIMGQIISIATNASIACFAIKMWKRNPVGLYYMVVNRVRYLNCVGWGNWLVSLFNKTELPTRKENDAYNVFKENPIYFVWIILFWSTIGKISGLLHQFGLNQVYSKPKEFFISVPIAGACIVYIMLHLVGQSDFWRKKSRRLESEFKKLRTDKVK